MTLIRCTKKLQKTLGIKSSDIASELNDSSVFGSWYANLIEINGSQGILFVNDKTLLNSIILEPHKNQAYQIKETFKSYLLCIFADEGFDSDFIDKVMAECSTIKYANTNSKKVLGSMNELAFMYICHFEKDSIHSYRLPEIVRSMNRVIMNMIKGCSVDAFRALG
jgi:hypothetical protein